MLLIRSHFYSTVMLSVAWIPGLLVFAVYDGLHQALLGGLALVLGPGSFLVRSWESEKVAEHDDNIAAKVLRDPDERRFVLYLRPFSSDGRFVPNAAYQPYANSQPKEIAFETLLVWAAARWGAVAKIHGETRTIDGMENGIGGVQLSDDEWEQGFVTLSQRARAIIMMPASSEGVLVELNSLRERDLLRNCVFILPHKYKNKSWRAAVKGLNLIGISIPTSLGEFAWAAFRVDCSLSVVDYRQFSPDRCQADVADLVSDIIAENSPTGSWRRNVLVRRWHRHSEGALIAAIAAPIIWWVWANNR